MNFSRVALLFLTLLVLEFSFQADASLTKTHAKEKKFRGSLKAGKAADDEDDDKDDSQDQDDEDEDEDDDKKEDKKEVKVAKISKEDLAVQKLKLALSDNVREQKELKLKLKHLTDPKNSGAEIDASAALVSNETQSPAMAAMLAKMWKEMRMFETPFWAEHVEEQMNKLKQEERVLEDKISAAQTSASLTEASSERKAKKEKKKEADADEDSAAAGGHEDCQCIGIDNLEGTTVATLKDGSKVDYPADLGGRCSAWDLDKHPSCPDAPWCKQKWCYVDPCKCKNVGVLPKPSVYLPDAKYQGKPVHFSYVTCGGKDSYSSEEEKKKTVRDIAKTCSAPVDTAKWGADNCRCIGVSPQPGTTKVMIKDKKVAFPADTGAVCNTWEKDNHPDCDSDDAPEWCNQAWCYVDPCSCKLPVPPKTSSYLPESTYQGKPIYYSYATCGGKDAWTASDKKACVSQKTAGACKKLDKCAWTGKECLGKELVNVCYAEENESRSGSVTTKVGVAAALALFAAFQ